MFAPLMDAVWIKRSEKEPYPHDGYAIVTIDGSIHVHPKRHEDVEVWVYVLAHCLFHLGFEHFKKQHRQDLWNIACDVYIAKFLDDFKLGRNPNGGIYVIRDLYINTEEQLYDDLLQNGVDKKLLGFGTGNPGEPDMSFEGQRHYSNLHNLSWRKRFGIGLRNAVTSAVSVAAGKQRSLGSDKFKNSDAEKARSWFMSSYPLLGSLVASYSLSRDVSRIRLVFCDASTYDQGYIAPEELLERVKIKGRGGTVLQPGINLLQKAEDFPKDGPILIITDGGCDKLSIKREHAFLVPSYGRLPFAPKGKLFRVQ